MTATPDARALSVALSIRQPYRLAVASSRNGYDIDLTGPDVTELRALALRAAAYAWTALAEADTDDVPTVDVDQVRDTYRLTVRFDGRPVVNPAKPAHVHKAEVAAADRIAAARDAMAKLRRLARTEVTRNAAARERHVIALTAVRDSNLDALRVEGGDCALAAEWLVQIDQATVVTPGVRCLRAGAAGIERALRAESV